MRSKLWITLGLLLKVWLLGLVPGCGNVGADSRSAQTQSGAVVAQTLRSAIQTLPAPSTLAPDPTAAPRSTSFDQTQLLKQAEEFSAVLPLNRVTADSDSAVFSPNWLPGTPGISGLAYATYSFAIPGYDSDPVLAYQWNTAPTNPGRTYVALANWDSDAWDWYQGNAEGRLELPSLDPYFIAGGTLLVCVLLSGEAVGDLDWLRIGSLPPVVSLSADAYGGMAPRSVTFTAEASDPDGTVAEYLWDPEGDGVFDQSSGTNPEFSFNYVLAGSYNAAVKVLDNSGIYTTAIAPVHAWAKGGINIGHASNVDWGYFCLPAADGSILLFGSTQVDPKSDLVYCKFTPGGEVLFSRAWGMPDEDDLNDVLLASDGFVYVAGGSIQLDGGFLQKWDQAGNLIWTRVIGDDSDHSVSCVEELGPGQIVVCTDASQSFGTNEIAVFDSDGDRLWARAVGDATCSMLITDLEVFRPAAASPELRFCGTRFDGGDNDILYGVLNDDGSFQSGQSWGDVGLDEWARCLVSAPDGTAYVAGSIYFGIDITVLSRVGGSSLHLTDVNVQTGAHPEDLTYTLGQGPLLLASLGNMGSVVGQFDTGMTLQSMRIISNNNDVVMLSFGALWPDTLGLCGFVNGAEPVDYDYSPNINDTVSEVWTAQTIPVTDSNLPLAFSDAGARDYGPLELHRNALEGDFCIFIRE